MILGLGNDIIDIRRIERTIARFGDRFLSRVFTPVERVKSDRRVQRAASYAKRFAAKEACSKALGTGFRRGVFWRDMGVVNLASGRPTMKLTGGALARLESLLPEGYEARIDVSLTDEPPLAQAIMTGHVRRSGLRVNEHSGLPFHWAEVESYSAVFDVVIDPELAAVPPVGGVVRGTFWLSGRPRPTRKRTMLDRLLGRRTVH